MSLFDFFFPEEAQASHLRRIADMNSVSQTNQRIALARASREQAGAEKKIKALEAEVAELTIVVEALLEILGDDGTVTRGKLAQKVAEIDARDGVIDGRITKMKEKHAEEAPKAPKFNFPDQGRGRSR